MYTLSNRHLVWFSCGAASACAAKLAVAKLPNAEILYCDMSSDEHPDNARFLSDCEKWIGRKFIILKSAEYSGIYDVFDKTRWLYGRSMAKCTQKLKRDLREAYQLPSDVHVFGYTIEEKSRIALFEENNPELKLNWILRDAGYTKQRCFLELMRAGIELPEMYKLGYKNNNCIGCIKGGKGYWNKIRRDFPERFERMAKQERKMGVRRFPDVWLDELPVNAGNYKKENGLDCGVACSFDFEPQPNTVVQLTAGGPLSVDIR